MKPKGTVIYLIAAIAAAFIWGFLTIPLKRLHHLGHSSEEILYYRVFASLTALWLYNLIFRRDKIGRDIALLNSMPGKERLKVILLLLATGVSITGNWYSYIFVVNHISVKVAASAYLICPLLTACGGFLILKEHLSRLQAISIAIAVAGIGILSAGSISQTLWSVVVAVFYAVYLVIQRVLTQFDKINMLGVQLVISTLMLLPFYIHAGHSLPREPEFWADIIIVAVVFTVIPLLLSLFALVGINSSTLGITIYINPIVTFIVAFVYFREGFQTLQLLAYLLLLIAVVIFNWEIIANIVKLKQRTKKA